MFRTSKINNIRFPKEKIHAEDTLFLLDFIKNNETFCWAEYGMYWHNDSNQGSYTKKKWSKSNLGLTKFYRELAETCEEYELSDLIDKTRVRYYQNLLSSYIRSYKHNYLFEANKIHEEMRKRWKVMLSSSLSLPLKFDFLLCVFCPRLGLIINSAYK